MNIVFIRANPFSHLLKTIHVPLFMQILYIIILLNILDNKLSTFIVRAKPVIRPSWRRKKPQVSRRVRGRGYAQNTTLISIKSELKQSWESIISQVTFENYLKLFVELHIRVICCIEVRESNMAVLRRPRRPRTTNSEQAFGAGLIF